MTLVSDIVSFILRYRKGDAFTNETPQELELYIGAAIATNCCVTHVDSLGTISGVILAKEYSERRALHIYGILTVQRVALRAFAQWLQRDLRKDWTITATRHGRTVEYRNTKRFLELLTK